MLLSEMKEKWEQFVHDIKYSLLLVYYTVFDSSL
jgi:hypothetical protein